MNHSPTAARLATRIERLKPSLVREILAVANKPGIISFAGGLPAPDLMPDMRDCIDPDTALDQYGASEGETAFRSAVAEWITHNGLPVAPSQVLALSGSQQGLDLAAKLLIDDGTPVVTESPSYLAALQVFELFGASVLPLALGRDGPDPATLDALLRQHRPACVYLIPSFQNPSGYCYSPEVRKVIAEVLDRHDAVLIEDDPYRSVSLDVTHPMQPICSYLKRVPWIYLGSFSKILRPGWRVGYLAASPQLMPYLVRLKQASDLHTQRPAQAAVANWLRHAQRDADLARLRAGYRLRRDAMQTALERHFGDLADWDVPQGGLFFWLRLRQHQATRSTLDATLARGVVFMPGESFYPGPMKPTNTMRLNYSLSTPAEMERGLAILADCIAAVSAA
ncbi:PLP-dependent aminotransferase family protein [Uliginosibacterium sp. H3]|uniref:PLP-dependent aminotransferase family protein n=1 Tax=Uliginosibacterium silvisoli TaxID=3114758 RepID=A0ABU6K815_9RHOO|nr:PLP-dependent aminotransferase family protein [Uliginosibacterium sp. H3]